MLGLFARIKRFIFGEPVDYDEAVRQREVEQEKPEMYNDYDYGEGAPTMIYDSEPLIGGVEIKGGGNVSMANNLTNREVQRINNSIRIPGQVNAPGPRGPQRQAPRGPRRFAPPRQAAPVAPAAPQVTNEQLAQQQYEQQRQYEQQQYEEQQEYMRQQQMAQQQQAYYQQQNQYYQQVPPQVTETITRVMANFGEPYCEMVEVNDKYHFFMDLPGVKPENVNVRYDNMYLYVSGTRPLRSAALEPKKGKGNKGKKPLFKAMVSIPPFVENFQYSFYFERPVVQDPSAFKIKIEDGVLHVEMTIIGDFNGPTGVSLSVGK